MRRLVRIAGIIGIIAAARPAGAQMSSLDDLDRDFIRLVENVAPSVVHVGPGFSGISISEDGFILTDVMAAREFLVEKKSTLAVTFPDQRRFDATLHAHDPSTRTSILKIDTRANLPSVRIGTPDRLAVGNFLLTVGNAFGTATEGEPAVTLGVVSSIERDDQGVARSIETSAATNPGQNGGPYFDVNGDLVGLAGALPDGRNLARVTPIDRIRRAYGQVAAADRIFRLGPSTSPRRSKAAILSEAFHIAATRARRGVVTIFITQRVATEGTPGEAEASEPTPDRDGAKRDDRSPRPAPVPSAPIGGGPITGTIVHEDGFVLTAEPPFSDDVESIEVALADGRRFRATLIARDLKAGLALLLLDKDPGVRLEPLPAAPANELRVGQFAIAVGAPHGPPVDSEPFVTVGIVSGTSRQNRYVDALQTDAGVNVKNAGGVLVDLRGRRLGVLLPAAPPFGHNSGLGFAIPNDVVARILPGLMLGKNSEPAFIGVVLSDAPGGGVLVTEVSAGFPGERAGLEVGDVITRLDGRAIANRSELTDFIWMHKSPNDELRASVLRGNEARELTILLTSRPR